MLSNARGEKANIVVFVETFFIHAASKWVTVLKFYHNEISIAIFQNSHRLPFYEVIEQQNHKIQCEKSCKWMWISNTQATKSERHSWPSDMHRQGFRENPARMGLRRTSQTCIKCCLDPTSGLQGCSHTWVSSGCSRFPFNLIWETQMNDSIILTHESHRSHGTM